MTLNGPHSVQWKPWSKGTFDEARLAGKPILINVAAAWCHWCHVMDEKTFADPRIAKILNSSYAAVRVDADARPDLAERYAEWGWPATAILTPDAQPLLELRGFQEPASFLDLIQSTRKGLRSGRLAARAPQAITKPLDASLTAIRDRVEAQLDSYFDEQLGGWGHRQKYPFSAPVEHAMLRARDDATWQGRVQLTLEGTRHLIDPVWGGVYQYSVNGTWTEPHFEKIAAIQAGCLDNFAQAYQASGNRRHLAAANQVASYLDSFLTSPTGGFWTSQDADAPALPGPQFYALGNKERLAVGMPRIDRNVYTDWNALIILALVRLHRATLDAKPLQAAIRAADSLLDTHRQPNGAFSHAPGRPQVLHLRDNALMGRALFALHECTGREEHLQAAWGVVQFILAHLASSEGGFHAHTIDMDAPGSLGVRRRPLEENGIAVRLLAESAWRLDDTDPQRKLLLECAEQAVRSLASDDTIKAEGRIIGQFLLGIEWLLLDPMTVVVQKGSDEVLSKELYGQALRSLTQPGVVRWGRDDEYPAFGGGAAYVCYAGRCSRPVTSPSMVPAALAAMGKPTAATSGPKSPGRSRPNGTPR